MDEQGIRGVDLAEGVDMLIEKKEYGRMKASL
jgi:hypothetical protein